MPEGLGALAPWYLNLFENPLTVQFDHRMLAMSWCWRRSRQAVWLGLRRGAQIARWRAPASLVMLSLLQATLGVWTLLLAVPISLGLAHQAGAMLLFAAALYHFWLARHGDESGRHAQTAASA